MNEQAVRFGESGSLFGVLTSPETNGSTGRRPAVVFLNSGILHRVGPNRMHVTMARDLAKRGHAAFRIDLSGIGDSPPRGGDLSIGERWAIETREAMDFLAQSCGANEFVLIGNCSGAGVAFLAATEDPRVVGTVLINLQGPRTYLRYYARLAFGTLATWRRLLRGSVRYRDLLASLSSYVERWRSGEKRAAEEEFDVDAALRRFGERGVNMLLVFCSWDPSLDFFRGELKAKLHKWIDQERLSVEIIPGMNHDFTLMRGQRHLRKAVADWAGWAQ